MTNDSTSTQVITSIEQLTYNFIVTGRKGIETIEIGNYTVGLMPDFTRAPFTHFNTNVKNPNAIRSSKDTGWKIHIGIDDSEQENLARGWEAIREILFKYQIYSLKIINPNIKLANNPTQSSKQITIYAFKQPNLDWSAFLNEIESALNQQEILPAPLSPKDKIFPGSRYLTYRYDADKDGRYLATENSESYNDAGEADPFMHIIINSASSSPQDDSSVVQSFTVTL